MAELGPVPVRASQLPSIAPQLHHGLMGHEQQHQAHGCQARPDRGGSPRQEAEGGGLEEPDRPGRGLFMAKTPAHSPESLLGAGTE